MGGERMGGLPTPARRPAAPPAAVVSPLPRTSHRPGATGMGWEQSSFLCQAKAEGLIFVCQEGNDLGDFPGDFLLPKASGWERGDAISQTSSGRTPGRQPPGQGVILCPRDMHIPTSEVVLSHRLTPDSQTMPKTPSPLQGKDAGKGRRQREGGLRGVLPAGPKMVQLPSPPQPKQPLRPLPTQGRARRGARAREAGPPAATQACPWVAACVPESITSNCRPGRGSTLTLTSEFCSKTGQVREPGISGSSAATRCGASLLLTWMLSNVSSTHLFEGMET